MGRSLVLQRLVHAVTTPGRLLVGALIGLLVIVLAFTGITQTLAVWNSQATASATATGAELDLTTDFGNASANFANHRTSVTGSFSLSNQTVTDSATTGHYEATIVAPGDQVLREALTVTIWPRGGDGCTAQATPQGVVASGTWADAPFTVSGDLAANGTTLTFCMRMAATERGELAASDGDLIINPSISATLSIGNWSDVATDSAVQATAYIFPDANPTEHVWYQLVNGTGTSSRCASVSNTGALSAATCNATSANQQVRFDAAGNGYQEIIPRSVAANRIDVANASTTPGSAVVTQSADSSRASQDWQMQYKGDVSGAATYQVVNRNSGLCLQRAGSSYSQQACDGTASQTFTLVVRGIDAATGVTCTSSNGNVTYLLSNAAVGPYVFGFQKGKAGPYAPFGTAVPVDASSVTFTPADIGSLLAAGENNVKLSWLGYDIATASVWKDVSNGVTTLMCEEPTLEVVNCVQAPPNSVTIIWGHNVPQGASYTLELVAGTGGTGNTQLAVVTSGDRYTLTPTTSWADGTRTIRVTSSDGPVIEVQIVKSGSSPQRLWCLTEAPVTATCSPAGTENRSTTVTVSWPTGSTRGGEVMLEIAGNDVEVFRDVSTDSTTGRSWFTVPARSLPSGQRLVTMTLIGDVSMGGLVIGTKTFDTIVTNTGPWWWPTLSQEYTSRCAG